MVEVINPNREFKPSLGVELDETRTKVLNPSLFREAYRNIEKVENDGTSNKSN